MLLNWVGRLDLEPSSVATPPTSNPARAVSAEIDSKITPEVWAEYKDSRAINQSMLFEVTIWIAWLIRVRRVFRSLIWPKQVPGLGCVTGHRDSGGHPGWRDRRNAPAGTPDRRIKAEQRSQGRPGSAGYRGGVDVGVTVGLAAGLERASELSPPRSAQLIVKNSAKNPKIANLATI